MPHAFDGSLNDGFCADCNKPRQDLVHHVEPSWREAWERSRQIRRALRERGTPDYHVRAQAEYDYCHAVSETPRTETPPTAKEWFRAEDVPLQESRAVSTPQRAVDLHVVRPAAAAAASNASFNALTRWEQIAKDRGGSYWQQVQPHLWAIAFLVVGVIIGAFSVTSRCP